MSYFAVTLTLATIAAICFALAALVLAVMVVARLVSMWRERRKLKSVNAELALPREEVLRRAKENMLKLTGWDDLHQWHRLHRYKNHLEHHRKVR